MFNFVDTLFQVLAKSFDTEVVVEGKAALSTGRLGQAISSTFLKRFGLCLRVLRTNVPSGLKVFGERGRFRLGIILLCVLKVGFIGQIERSIVFLVTIEVGRAILATFLIAGGDLILDGGEFSSTVADG